MTIMSSALLGIERSLSGRRWTLRDSDDRTAMAISQQLSLPEIVGRVLAGRGIAIEEAARFLAPTLRDHLPDPSHLLDMDKAAERVAQAIVAGELIAVFGDYDVDGATSSALLSRFFAALGAKVRIYIPDRRVEGYGPNIPALLRLKAEGAKIVITVDCGTMAHEPLEAAAEAGLDVIVVDHHQAESALPRAFAIVNPNRLDETSPHGALAAVGVAFLLVVAVNRVLRQKGFFGQRAAPDLMQWLDIVALGTVCDVVPLNGINRALVAQGLKVMARRANKGMAALADIAGLKERPDAYHLGYLLGPRVNAGGRVGGADLGARLLATEDEGEAGEIARRLDEFNKARQEIEAAVLFEAIEQIEGSPAEDGIALAAGDDWHPGVIGIVAGRLRERYSRPSCVIAFEGDEGKGSGRSVPGVDLGAAIIAARQSGLLVKGGGHAMAAGFTVMRQALPAFRHFLAERVAAQTDGTIVPVLELDGAVEVSGCTLELIETLRQIGPFGSGNAEPRFALPAVRVQKADMVGAGHVRCFLAGQNGSRLKAMAFRAADTDLGLALLRGGGQTMHLAGTLRAETWQGQTNVQFTIEDGALPR
jgi:single-stranded-DNA-specific exonuclease